MAEEKKTFTKADVANSVVKTYRLGLLIGMLVTAMLAILLALIFSYRGNYLYYIFPILFSALAIYITIRFVIRPLVIIIKMKRLSFVVEEDYLSGFESVHRGSGRYKRTVYYYDFSKSGSFDSGKNLIMESLFKISEPGDKHYLVKLRSGKRCPVAVYSAKDYSYTEK